MSRIDDLHAQLEAAAARGHEQEQRYAAMLVRHEVEAARSAQRKEAFINRVSKVVSREVVWLLVLALDLVVFTPITRWVWSWSAEPLFSAPALSVADACIITLLASVLSYLITVQLDRDRSGR